MNAIFIKPAEGLLVRDPETMQPLSAEGEHKPRTPHWARRLAAGDVVEMPGPGTGDQGPGKAKSKAERSAE